MMPASGLVIGYHGCDKVVGEAAIAGTHPGISTNSHDWLGHGLYFWQNDAERARLWAASQLRVKDPFVLGAVVNLGNCLDLIEIEHLSLLQEAHGSLLESLASVGRQLPKNRAGYKGDSDRVKRELDCAVINYLHDFQASLRRPAFDTVRSPFWEGSPVYEGSGIMARTHVQICVRVPKDSILGYFRPLG